jgi:hypothetical protein
LVIANPPPQPCCANHKNSALINAGALAIVQESSFG